LELLEARLVEAGVISAEQAAETRAAARKWAIDARKVALAAPMPDPSTIADGVYAQ
jgi:pyruvate dehydrogenase E1 component alpha subunit